MSDHQYNEIMEILTRMDADLINDRTKIDNIINELATLKSQVTQLYSRLPRTEEKIQDAVTNALDKAVAKKPKKSLLSIIKGR